MGDQIARGEEFERKGEKKLSGWGLFGSKQEHAAELFDKAANAFKHAKSWDQAGLVYVKLASCHLKPNMEALRTETVVEGDTTLSSVLVVSQVLSQNSSNTFLKSVGIKPVAASKSSSYNEGELGEQLAAEAVAAVQGELQDLKKRSEEAEEKLVRTQNELEEYKRITQENNALLKRILSLNNDSST